MTRKNPLPTLMYHAWVNQDGRFCHCHISICKVTETVDVNAKWKEAVRDPRRDLELWRTRIESFVANDVQPFFYQTEEVIELVWQSDDERGFFQWYAQKFNAELTNWELASTILKKIAGDYTTSPTKVVNFLEAKGIRYVKYRKELGGDVVVPIDLAALQIDSTENSLVTLESA
jgi:hypothetical protein